MALQAASQITTLNTTCSHNDLEMQRKYLQTMLDAGIVIDVDDAMKKLKEKEFKEKEEKVLSIHPYAITKTEIPKRGKRVVRWQTTCGEKRPRCSSYESLINKLYDHYFSKTIISDYSFKNIFDLALDEYRRTSGSKENTIDDYRSSYKTFITEEFEKLDIRFISTIQLTEYILNTTIRIKPKEKRFYRFKGILNLVFNYACSPNHQIINYSPVPKKNDTFKKHFSPTSKKPEDKAFQPTELELIREYCWKRTKHYKYDVNAYAMLFAAETGLRLGEIPTLKWTDVKQTSIHIHSQQTCKKVEGKKCYFYTPSTKDEKGVSKGGRHIPLTEDIRKILVELKQKQESLGITSEWVFCKKNGNWITTVSYYEALLKACTKLGLKLTNNHAFRIALNSYVYVDMDLSVAERAKILGHSVKVNLENYTMARTDDYLEELSTKIDAFKKSQNSKEATIRKGTSGYLKNLGFKIIEKSPKLA